MAAAQAALNEARGFDQNGKECECMDDQTARRLSLSGKGLQVSHGTRDSEADEIGIS
jgi:hypothetical protein